MIIRSHQEIKDYLDLYVSGQDEVKDKLSVLGNLYTGRCTAIEAGIRSSSLPRLNVFLTGPTGTGKTLLLRTLADCLDVPMLRVDCSSMSQVGWEGTSIDKHLKDFSDQMGVDGFAIIMLDEFDKLGNLVHSSTGGVPSLGVQNNLLDLLDGTYSAPRVNPAINNSLILCAGAFAESTKQAKKVTRGIGFEAKDEIPNIVWKDLMVKSGIIPELAGRLLDVAETKKLTKEEIRDVIMNPITGTRKQYSNLYMGIKFDEKDIDKLVDTVYDSEYGLRELDTALFKMVQEKIVNGDTLHESDG